MIAPTDHTLAPEEYSSSPEVFRGFNPITANFLYCPNQFIDVCIAQCNTRGVVRIVAYVIRQTLGWVDEHGNPINKDVTVSRKDIIEKAGVSNGAAGTALDLAVALGFLICTQEPRPHAQQQTAQNGTYELRWDRSGNYVSDLDSFQGFHAGSHFTPVPNQFFDVIIRNEPLSDVKVVGALIRHTIGYTTKCGQRKQRAALSQLDLARYTNLSTGKTINGAVQSTLRKGYIQCVKQGVFDSRGREFGDATEYAIRWRQKAISTANAPKSPAKESGVDLSKKPSENAPKSPAKKRSKKPSNRNTSKKDTSKQQQDVAVDSKAYRLLRDIGFDERTAKQLAEKRGVEEIERQIAWIDSRNPEQNELGMLRRAIENNWPKPPSVQQREKQDSIRTRQDEANAQWDEEERASSNRKKKRVEQRQVLLSHWRRFPLAERRQFHEQTIKQATSGMLRRRLMKHSNLDEPPNETLQVMASSLALSTVK